MGKIIIKNEYFTFEEVKNNIKFDHLDLYSQYILSFCSDWLNGQKEVEVQTSGSTGTPKRYQFARKQLIFSAQSTIKALSLCEGNTVYMGLPFDAIGGKMMLIRALEGNMDIVVEKPSSTPLETVSNSQPIHFASFVPMQLNKVLEDNNPLVIKKLLSINKLLLGGAAISGKLEKQLQSFPNEVYASYGMTETASHIALRRVNGKEATPIFRAFDNVTLSQDSRGCLTIQSPVTNNIQLQTNDRVDLISSNTFRWLGRWDNVINSGGIKIQVDLVCEKIEPILEKEGFSSFKLVGLVHPIFGEAVTLLIETNEQALQKDALLKSLSLVLSPYEVPKAIICVPEFKKTSTGKVDCQFLTHEFRQFYTETP